MMCNNRLVKYYIEHYQKTSKWGSKLGNRQCSVFSLIYFVSGCDYKNRDCVFRHRCQFMRRVRDWLR